MPALVPGKQPSDSSGHCVLVSQELLQSTGRVVRPSAATLCSASYYGKGTLAPEPLPPRPHCCSAAGGQLLLLIILLRKLSSLGSYQGGRKAVLKRSLLVPDIILADDT